MSTIDKRKQSFYLTQETVDALVGLSLERERSVSYLVGQAINHWLAAGAPNCTRHGGHSAQDARSKPGGNNPYGRNGKPKDAPNK